ncbi:hypothetical protein H5P28_03955 [Ruficoccus amylovorans]|uniref:Uncharacterized protein n=1 Tax=Ruficoccus amylovorans TaxID=1804625 RepID=A0A842HCT0_9BACT|nr:hypothetical protein [Ruficoccus amylovorans]MBC2593407.1 hypothetical protein [Ruficoccus amylovorans]
MKPRRIKIAVNPQSALPIYLHSNGDVVCGVYRYKPTKLRRCFRGIFDSIIGQIEYAEGTGEVDVSGFSEWDAMSIYDEFIGKTWESSLSAEKLEELAMQTSVVRILKQIRDPFWKAVYRRWSRERRHYGITDPRFPKENWEVFLDRGA